MSEAIIITVEGMGCQGCVTAVEKAVRSVAPEAKVNVSLANGSVSIAETGLTRSVLEAAISKAGYDIVG